MIPQFSFVYFSFLKSRNRQKCSLTQCEVVLVLTCHCFCSKLPYRVSFFFWRKQIDTVVKKRSDGILTGRHLNIEAKTMIFLQQTALDEPRDHQCPVLTVSQLGDEKYTKKSWGTICILFDKLRDEKYTFLFVICPSARFKEFS